MAFRGDVEEITAENRNGLLTAHTSWERIQLNEVAEVLNGFAFKSAYFTPHEGMPLLRIRDVLSDSTDAHYAGEFDSRYLVQPGELVIGMDGNFNSALWAGPTALLNQRVCKVSPDERLYDRRLLSYVLPGYLSAINEETSSVTVKHLSSRTVQQIPLPLPPLPEQRRIVAEIEKQFTRLDAAVAALERARANLKRYRASVLAAACEGRLVPTEAELARQEGRDYEPAADLLDRILAEHSTSKPKAKRAGRLWGAGEVPELTREEQSLIPEGWTWCKVRDLGVDQNEAVQVGPMSLRSRDFEESGVPVLNVGCVQWDSIDESKLNHLPEAKTGKFDRYRIKTGDVLFTRSGTVGRCAVALERHDDWLMTFHLLRVRPDPSKCDSNYLRAAFEGAPHIRRQTREASIGTTRAGFNTNLLADLDIPLPPRQEQIRIVAEVERRLSVVGEMERAVEADLQRAGRLRQAILKRAFEGRLVAQDPNDEPASVLLERIRAEREAASSKGQHKLPIG